MTREKERDLVRRCVAAEEQAWEELLQRYRAVIVRAVGDVLRSQSSVPTGAFSVEDRVSSVYEHLLKDDARALQEFRGNCALSTWLFLIASRLTRNALKAERREFRKRQKLQEAFARREEPSSPLDRLGDKERRELLRKGLNSLSDEEKTLLDSLYVEGKSYEELSRIHALPVGTLSARITRLKQALMRRLKHLMCILL